MTELDRHREGEEIRRLAHCHRCGKCICYYHEAISDDSWDQHHVICKRCADVAA
jgi:hypothetical protein